MQRSGEGVRPSPLQGPLLSSSSCRFCGEKPQFVVASQNNRLTVRFHSDQSYTDTGFLAEYLSYDSSDREFPLLPPA